MTRRKVNNQSQIQSEQTMPEQDNPGQATPEQAMPEQDNPEQEAMETGIEKQQEATSEATLKGDENFKHIQNWRVLRERTEKAERERDEFFNRLQKIEQANSAQMKSAQMRSESTDEDLKQRISEQAMPELNDDDLVEAKHLKSHLKKSDEKNAQRIAMLEAQLIESRLKSEYSDFDKVVNVDTLGMLRDVDPELAESITANPNIYSKAVTAYKSIKRYGLISEDHYSKERDKVHANVAKPRPVSSVSPQQGESPLSRANAFAEGLTPELAKELWKEMQQCQKKS